jgi:hypothetical protein
MRSTPCSSCAEPIPYGQQCWLIHTTPPTTMCNSCHEKVNP